MSELLCKFQIVALCLVVMKQTNEAVSQNYESCVVDLLFTKITLFEINAELDTVI